MGLGVISRTGPWRSSLTIPQKQSFAKTTGWPRLVLLIEGWNHLVATGLMPSGASVDAESQWHCAVIDSRITSRYNGLASPAERNTMMTELSYQEWDEQFTRQAGWTRGTRAHLYRRANLLRAGRVLDVGSGTGVLTEELAERTQGQVVGVDLDPGMVDFSRKRHGKALYQSGDAHDLAFRDGWFDLVVCHFLLLWCADAARVAQEMIRVTRPGGAVVVCAEPDYGGRIDYPDLPLGRWQSLALRREGADPQLGRKLRGLFALPGVRHTELGLIPGLWDLATLRAQFDAEWSLWERSLTGLVPPDELARVKDADLAAIQAGERLVFMPVFYALMKV